ncbi:MAG: flagellar filament capping protein FliD [Candidatus Korobacteraceae bacterium]
MSSVGLSSSNLASLLGSSSASSTDGIDLSSLLEVATGSSSEGIDVTDAVNAAVTAAETPETQWQTQATTLQGQESDLNTVNSQVSSVENDLSSLNSLTGAFSSISAESSDTNVVTASAAAGATIGTNEIEVSNLAATSSWYSTTSVASASTGLSAGSLSLQVGSGTATPINISSGETLDQLVSAINGQSLGVTASVVNDASGSRLSIVSNSSGSANNITITNTSPQLTQASDGSAWNSGLISDSTGASAGSFSIQVGSGAATQITASAGESLSALASDINGQSLGVTASVVSNGNGSSQLSVVNNATGNASGMTITNTSPQFTQATQGINASLTVNGIPISSASNTVTGAIPGVTLNLGGTTSGDPVELSVTADPESISSAIQQFVNDYNTVVGSVNDEYTYSSTNSTQGPLAGDSTLGLLQNALLGAGSYSATSNGTTTTLGSLGITMNNDGTLSVNSTTLDDALQNNPSAVQNFFEGPSLNGFANALNTQLQSLTDPADGAFTVDLSSMKSTYNELEDNITNFQQNYITPLQTSLTAEYSSAEIALQTLNTTKQEINAELGNNNSSSGN